MTEAHAEPDGASESENMDDLRKYLEERVELIAHEVHDLRREMADIERRLRYLEEEE